MRIVRMFMKRMRSGTLPASNTGRCGSLAERQWRRVGAALRMAVAQLFWQGQRARAHGGLCVSGWCVWRQRMRRKQRSGVRCARSHASCLAIPWRALGRPTL